MDADKIRAALAAKKKTPAKIQLEQEYLAREAHLFIEDDTARLVIGPRWLSTPNDRHSFAPQLRVVYNGDIIYIPRHWPDGIDFCQETFGDTFVKVDLRK